jgi:hypothetical protein
MVLWASHMDESWLRKKGESAKAYAAFMVYRNAGVDRSQVKVANALGKSRVLVNRWAQAWQWTERCVEWEAHLQRLADAAREKQVKDVIERHSSIAAVMTGRVIARLEAMTENAMELTAQDVARWFDIAVKVERLSLGMATQTMEHSGQGGGAIKLDVMQQARARLAEKLTSIDAELAAEGPKDGT